MSGIDDVRKVFAAPEEMTPAAVDGIAPPPRTPGAVADPNPIGRAAAQPLNDYGNGQRFVIHFGRDVIFVPRVGWFVWTGQVWEYDPPLNSKNGPTSGGIAVRARAQKIWALIEKEIDHLRPTAREEKLLGEERELRGRLKTLEALPEADRTDTHTADVGAVVARLRALGGLLKDRKSLIGRRLTHAKNAGNNGPIGHMLTEATTDLAVAFEELDRNPLDVNTRSGLLRFTVSDLREQGGGRQAECRLIPHDRAQFLTKMMPVAYDPKAAAARFHAFLERIQPDPEMRGFLQRWFGLSMSGLKVQKLVFLHGAGANGKSVLVDVMGRIMAGYAASLKIESLTGANRRSGAEATPDLIPLLGARFVRTSEPDQGEKLQESLIKQLTGGEPIPVRPNYGDQIDMDADFKITLSGNHRPVVRGTDDGIWRRVLLVPFDVQIPESEQDDALGEKLWAERDGIFAWLAEGLLDYLEGGLRPPSGVMDATREYREDSDPIGSFLTSCCEITGDHADKVSSKELGQAFNHYLTERGETTWKPTTFALQIAARSRHWKHPETGRQFTKTKASVSQYAGLRFTEAFRRRWESARDPGADAAPAAPDPFWDDFGG
ncbi:MAG: phage/plasmid primase, P4 family [Pseudomonadota bacterium]